MGISAFDLTVEGNEALATFTRRDIFRNVRSGRPMELEVCLSTVLSRTDGAWNILRLKKPS